MIEEDFTRIEKFLGVRLPDAYRQALAPFPVPQESGNTDTSVWDDSAALIVLNQRLRAEIDNWPPWLVVIGQSEGDPCGYAIDTRLMECPIWWLDQMKPGGDSGPDGPFAIWFSRRVTDASERPGESSLLWIFAAWIVMVAIGLMAYVAWSILGSIQKG